MSKGQKMAPNLRTDRAQQDAAASQTEEGAAQLLQIKGKMAEFVAARFGSGSSGKLAESVVNNDQFATNAFNNLTARFQEFAKGEKEFAAYIQMYDEEAVVK